MVKTGAEETAAGPKHRFQEKVGKILGYSINEGVSQGTQRLIAIIDASCKVNEYYNGVCIRRRGCYVCVRHFALDSKYVHVTCFALTKENSP